MREIVAVCHSRKAARKKAARIFDRYLWRIGTRTWRGFASNECLARISSEMKAVATRALSMAIYETSSRGDLTTPLVFIGSRATMRQGDGTVPVRVSPAGARARRAGPVWSRRYRTILALAALLHDVGKSSASFQAMLQDAIRGAKPRADLVRHEVLSAVFWDEIFVEARRLEPADPWLALATFDVARFRAAADRACDRVVRMADAARNQDRADLVFELLKTWRGQRPSPAQAVLLLVLTHHRLLDDAFILSDGSLSLKSDTHVRTDAGPLAEIRDLVRVPEGCGLWDEPAWREAWQRALETAELDEGLEVPGLDFFGRLSLMLADHLGSAQKEATPIRHAANGGPGDAPCQGSCGGAGLANTKRPHGGEERRVFPADTVLVHTRRVASAARGAANLMLPEGPQGPALLAAEIPEAIAAPVGSPIAAFAWQYRAAEAARRLCSAAPGGFFACLTAGTGTGKTRGGPTVLAAAALSDPRPRERALRFNLALGLRVLAHQSGAAYTRDLKFAGRDVAILTGRPPLRLDGIDDVPDAQDQDGGSEDRLDFLSDLRVDLADEWIPAEGEAGHDAWIASLAMDHDRGIPDFVSRMIQIDRHGPARLRTMYATPILCATIDHFMAMASPRRSRHVVAGLRIAGSDMIIDEIDAFSEEDLSAVARLAYFVGVAGRRLVVMSATLTPSVADCMFAAYSRGYREFALVAGSEARIHALVAGDGEAEVEAETILVDDGDAAAAANGARQWSPDATEARFAEIFARAQRSRMAALEASVPLRVGTLVPVSVVDGCWQVREAISGAIEDLHRDHHSLIDGVRVSVGLVRITRVEQAAAVAVLLARDHRPPGVLVQLVCLHSRFPEAQRRVIEERAARMLRRKPGMDGLEPTLLGRGILERARREGASDIQIIYVTSPVIETGNDLDFDYAVIDPVSSRSIVQTAGRVNRHRMRPVSSPNVAILDIPLVALRGGLIALPGPEGTFAGTGCAPMTVGPAGVEARALGRLLDLGDHFRIDARLLERETILTRLEREACDQFVGGSGRLDPRCYASDLLMRVASDVYRLRRFRRQTRPETEVWPMVPSLRIDGWKAVSTDRPAAPFLLGRHVIDTVEDQVEDEVLFYPALFGEVVAGIAIEGHISESRQRRYLATTLPLEGSGVEYDSFTGFTTTRKMHLFSSFDISERS